MTLSSFYNAEFEEQLAINLFNGWGYNFYRAENQLRADDLMVRARVSEMLGAARAGVNAAEAAWRRSHLPPPSREHPRPDPQALVSAKTIEAVGAAIGALEGQIRALPVPEADRMTQRLRNERQTLEALLRADRTMVALAHGLRSLLENAAADTVLESEQAVHGMLSSIAGALQARRDLLAVV